MDHLSQLLNRLSLSAGVFYTGSICGVRDFDLDSGRGHVHLVRRGPVRLVGGPGRGLSIAEPSLLFMPRRDAHQLMADDRYGADIVCASALEGLPRPSRVRAPYIVAAARPARRALLI